MKVLPTGDRLFWYGLPLLLALALGHSLWATSLDGFTIDEPYHIAAGASYLRWGELGNFALRRGETAPALRWYELARKDAAAEPDILKDVEQQIQKVESAPAGTLVPVLRNPAKE